MPPTHPSLDDDSLPPLARTPSAGTRSPASADAVVATVVAETTVPAGRLPAWEVGTLEPPPHFSGRNWTALIGPGILLAGSSIGAGEWLFGPAVTAQFGGTFLWLATISIVTQVFYNLEVMRYTLYCGEPIFCGFFRLVPGPKFWTAVYLVLCIAHIWPFMAANAAVPLTAAVLGHLPGNGNVSIVFWTVSESYLVKLLGYVIFLLAFLPLIFGGKIYNVLERMMAAKLVIVLGFLVSVAIFLISPRNAWEVFAGFFRFGQVALRAETVIAGPHFDVRMREGSSVYIIKGTYEGNKGAYEGNRPVVTQLGAVDEQRHRTRWFDVNRPLPPNIAGDEERLLAHIGPLAKPGHFLVETTHSGNSFRISGEITAQGEWFADHVVEQQGNSPPVDHAPADLTGRDKELVDELVHNQGFERAGLVGYWREHGGLPSLDWPLLAALSAIAGAGMLSNALFSNYARDKGWGMGAQTGAIPSAIGGHRIALSHVGKVFVVDEAALTRWRGWFRHILRDQAIWMTCSFIGMALPCMMSLEFIRNAPVSENRVAALTADGLASRFPAYATFWWATTLFIGFIVLAPNAVFAGDLIARLWTDLIWIGSAKVKDRPGHSVHRIYYGILALYCVWGLVALTIMNPLQIAIIGPVLGNVALGFSAFHTLAANRRLLPEALRPNLFMQLGLFACGVFFLGITAIILFAPPG
jgi:hypothetical protein